MIAVITSKPLVVCIALLGATPVFGQGTNVTFGTMRQDTSAPVEVAADNLSVDQATGKAVFQGHVVIGQGDLRLAATKVEVEYQSQGAGIANLVATGDVMISTGSDAAEAARAVYNIDSGKIVLTGNVLLTQGASALTADKAEIDLQNGKANISGRVKTILQTGGN